MHTVTVYHADGTKETRPKDDVPERYEVALNFHERILKTYYQLEVEGKLNDQTPEQKQFIRQVHEDAQHPEYWGEKDTLGYLPD